MSLPNCYRVSYSQAQVYYEGDWGKCTFNYRTQALVWSLLSDLGSFVLWIAINQYAWLFMKEHFPGILFDIIFIVSLFLSMILCSILKSWFIDVMFDHVQMKVKRNQKSYDL